MSTMPTPASMPPLAVVNFSSAENANRSELQQRGKKHQRVLPPAPSNDASMDANARLAEATLRVDPDPLEEFFARHLG
jgi:hypothetical protein